MLRKVLTTLIALLPFLWLLPGASLAQEFNSNHFKEVSPTIAPGGYSSSANFQIYGSVGETAHDAPVSSSFGLNLGFFSYPEASAPSASAVVGNVSQRVDLSWTASIPYLGYTVSGYKIAQATVSGGPYTYTAVGNVLSSNVTGLTNGTTYYFVIVATDNAALSIASSTEISAVPVAPSLTFVVDSGSQSLPALSPGNLVATSSILTVKTTNTSGFAATVVRSTTAATLALNSNPGVTITDKTDWFAPPATTSTGNATASTTEPLTLQFRLWQAQTDTPNYASAWWGSNDTLAGALFAGISSTTQTIANRSVSALSTTTMRVLYNINVPVTQKTGTYTGDIVYSVTANP